MTRCRLCFVILFLPLCLFSAVPRLRTFNAFADFSRARLQGITVLAEGSFTLGARPRLLLDSGDPYIWSVVADRKGNLYLGSGNDGRIYRISPAGDSTLFFDAPELEVYALTMGPDDRLYAATSPRGKVYQIDASGRSRVFFEPKENYIWALAWDRERRLLVATGDKARIYQVSADGRGEAIATLTQAHVRCLAVDGNGVIYAGSSGSGCVYRLASDRSPFLLFDTQLEEVNSLALWSDGALLAAACGGTSAGFVPTAPTVQTRTAAAAGESAPQTTPETTLETMSLTIERALPSGVESSLFVIDAAGYGKNIWNQPGEQVQVLANDGVDSPLVGTGPKGNLYCVQRNGETSLLFSASSGHISALASVRGRPLIVATSNPGWCYALETGTIASGSYESETIDAGMISTWGALSWKGRPNAGTVQFYTRSGNASNPENSWSAWSPLQKDGEVLRISSPAARFLQFRCDLAAGGEEKPVVEEITVSYLQTNRPPEITAVMVFPQNDYYSPGESATDKQESDGLVYPAALGKSEKKKGWRTVQWLFEDANLDGLSFSLFYQREGDALWHTLVQDLQSNIHSWDSSQMEDGVYRLKVQASDRPSVPEPLALTAEKTSDAFVIDNTAPLISFSPGVSTRQILCRIQDSGNLIDSIEYSLNAQGWKKIYPQDGICDSRQELIAVMIPESFTGSVQLGVKAGDAAGNFQVAHTKIRVGR